MSSPRSPDDRRRADDESPLRVDEGDHERFSHYVPKDKLTEAMVMGTPVVALCGKVWVPSRDPERFPVCPECKEVWENMSKGDEQKSGRTPPRPPAGAKNTRARALRRGGPRSAVVLVDLPGQRVAPGRLDRAVDLADARIGFGEQRPGLLLT